MNEKTMMRLKKKLEIGDIHVLRIKEAIKSLSSLFPLTVEKIEKFTLTELGLLELLTNRFAKLQDLLGEKIFTLLLELIGELNNYMTFIDKLNRLEKLGIINSAEEWQIMREIRNHMVHEYPDHPELTAQHLNEVYRLIPTLLNYFEKITVYARNLEAKL